MWYKQYGWKNNPFSIKPTIDLVDFESEKEKLYNYVSGGNVCLLVGEAGTGKTSLLKWLEYNLKKLIEAGIVVNEGKKYILRQEHLGALIDEIRKDIWRTCEDMLKTANEIDEELMV